MTRHFYRIYGWLTESPAVRPWFEIDPYFSPFGKDWETIPIPKGHKVKPKTTGWCSWYCFGFNVTEEKVLANAEWIATHKDKVPIEYIQIDAGWSPFWGDWQTTDLTKFPQGIKETVKKIKKMGFKAGIWISPFQMDLRCETARKHPDWVVHDKNGQPVFGHPITAITPSFLWPKMYLRNVHNPEAYKDLLDSVDFLIKEVGFELLKIDFMCGPYFDPAYTDPKRPDNMIHLFLSYIKNVYPEVYTLTGVSPIAPTAGLTDAVRVSDDTTSPLLDGVWPINAIVHDGRLKQLEENLKARAKLAKIWTLDPDVFVCRKSVGFSDKQIEKLAKLIKSYHCQRWLGDDLPNLPTDRVERFIYPLFT